MLESFLFRFNKLTGGLPDFRKLPHVVDVYLDNNDFTSSDGFTAAGTLVRLELADSAGDCRTPSQHTAVPRTAFVGALGAA